MDRAQALVEEADATTEHYREHEAQIRAFAQGLEVTEGAVS